MADETELIRKRRGRYREYMRHSNPCIFPAARRQKGNLQKVKKSSNVTHNGFNKCESDVQKVLCEQPRELRFTLTSSHHELLQAETADTSNRLHGWSRLGLSPFLSDCRLEMQFSIHNCTREFQGETASLLTIQTDKAQGTSKFKFSFCSKKILG